ncbi:EAL domain-containing protein [Vibrio aestuarianus]|nr:GGDEF domain-containing phosphodiesterase [Vibrio aestuarianus]MDE1339619.1 EAL domain-containing protein [Vibrio aestuarianus]
MIMLNKIDKKIAFSLLTTTFYFASVSAISFTLLTEHRAAINIYLLFPIAMVIARLHRSTLVKRLTSLIAISTILIGSYIEPLDIDAIEETFILIPLCYIVIFPGSLLPILSAVLLIFSYLHNLPAEQFIEFREDAIELMTIAIFATVMVYYQQKWQRQITQYEQDSLTDFLTGLANRKAFTLDLQQIAKETPYSDGYALIQLDLDDFKKINDNLGHHFGDLVLIEFSNRLKDLPFERINIYRLSGDEFAMIIKDRTNIRHTAEYASNQLKDISNQQFSLENRSYSMTFSIGIALLEDALHAVDIWCRNADIAVYRAKSRGKNTIQWYDEALIDETIRNYQIERELISAIERNQLLLYYQPKINIKSNRIQGAEALIRWQHPELGMISPVEFIGTAEKSQQIIAIGQWIIQTACQQAKQWSDQGYPICVSVNVSAVQFVFDDIFHIVTEALKVNELDPNLLQLEITETTLMEHPDKVAQTCNALRKLGVSVAIDDFGVAYSSLNYLKQLPVDVLKIDKSFVDDCVDNHNDHMIVKTIIQLGHNIGKQVTAEGVETEQQLSLLNTEGCDNYQGYLFSKPIPAKQFSKLLLQYSATFNSLKISNSCLDL